MTSFSLRHTTALSLSCVALAAACGASDDSTTGKSGASGAGANGSVDPNDPNAGPVFVTDPNQPIGQATCGGDIYKGEGRDLDMYIMMDRSGSMVGLSFIPIPGVPLPPNVWVPIGTAIGEFVVAPEATGINVGIQFFPLGDPGCDVNAYATPAAAVGLLPGNASAIQAAIVNNQPDVGGTPTVPAMQGAVQFARGWATQNPTHKTIVVLATDGEPNDCNSDIPGVAAAAADGFNGSPSIETYVIGIGNVAGLNEVAAAGGSDQALIVDADPAVAQAQFMEAMNSIRGRALPCDYGMPADATDPTRVNLDFILDPNNVATTTRIGNVANQGACDPARGGWYYNDDQTRLFACPSTCNHIAENQSGQVSVVVGCVTEIQ